MEKANILSVLTDVFSLKSNDDNKTIVFFLPGNPGVLNLYVHFLESLYNFLNQSVSSTFSPSSESTSHSFNIHACGHANHHLHYDAKGENITQTNYGIYGLNFQIDHYTDYINQTLKTYAEYDPSSLVPNSKFKIILIGHSIGAYMAIKILQKNVQLRQHVSYVSMLMPFIFWRNLNLSHRWKLKYTPIAVIKMCIRCFFCLVPRQLLKYLWMHSNNADTSIAEISSTSSSSISSSLALENSLKETIIDRLYSPRMLDNFFSMGVDEIDLIQREELIDFFVNDYLPNKAPYHYPFHVHMLHTDQDVWSPVQDISTLRDLITQHRLSTSATAEVTTTTAAAARTPVLVPVPVHDTRLWKSRYIKGLTHSFTLSETSANTVANTIVQCLRSSDPSSHAMLMDFDSHSDSKSSTSDSISGGSGSSSSDNNSKEIVVGQSCSVFTFWFNYTKQMFDKYLRNVAVWRRCIHL